MGTSATFLRGACFVLSEPILEGRAASRPIAKTMNADVKTLLRWTARVGIRYLQRMSSGYPSGNWWTSTPLHSVFTSRSPGICELDGETVLVKLRRGHCHQNGERVAPGGDIRRGRFMTKNREQRR